VLVSGEVREGYRGGGKVMHHPDVEMLGASGELVPRATTTRSAG